VKKLVLQQLHGWWFILCTLLTVYLFQAQFMGNNFFVYLLFDCVITVLGKWTLSYLHRKLDQRALVDEMLAQTKR